MDADPNIGTEPLLYGSEPPRRADLPSRRRPTRARPRRGRPRLRVWIPVLLVVFLSPAMYSWVQMARLPSSLPLGVRTVEWMRQHHFNWLIDNAESVYYTWKAPAKGGPQLKTLPAVGVGDTTKQHVKAKPWPRRIKPVFAQPLPGEGVWKPATAKIDGKPPVLVTTFRTETDYPRIVAYVAWFDHTRTALAYYPGRYEPPSATLRGPMEVPPSQRWRLLATFNSGFIYADGLNGDALNGHVNEPLKDGLATVVAYRNGGVNIITWHGATSPGPNIAFARQSLPLIIDHGRLNPKLSLGTEWGYTLGNSVRTWRTGLGIDKRGNIIYASANYQTVITLAHILKRAGAVRAMELDINPEWYTLITYRHHHGLVPTQVPPNYQQPDTRYLVPDDRDFFAVYRRLPGPIGVPLK